MQALAAKTLRVLAMLMLSAPMAPAALHFGTNEILPGELMEFKTTPNGRAQAAGAQAHVSLPVVRGALMLPAGYTNLLRPCPLLIVSVPSGGSALGGMRAMTNAAWREGWAVFAAEGPRVIAEVDTPQYNWGLLSSALDHLARTWPAAKQWPAACAGFSGGAKRSAAVAAAMSRDGWNVAGVFMGGCNEDRTMLGQRLFAPGSRFKKVPMFLSNGESDPIAGPGYGTALRDSMLQSGFTSVRAETYGGGHRLDEEQLREALRWFKQVGSAVFPKPDSPAARNPPKKK